MSVTVRAAVSGIDGHLVPVCPGASRMHLKFNHRQSCRLEATMRRLQAHPELVAHGPVVIVLGAP